MATSRSRLIRRIAYVLVGLVILAFIITRFLQPQSGPEYVTVKAETGDVAQTVELTGTTEPKTRYQLQFPKNGQIGKIHVKVGDVVKEGDVLAVLQNDDAMFQLESQKAALRIAQANLAKALAGQRGEAKNLDQLKVDLAQLDLTNSNVSQQNMMDLAQKNVNSAYLAVQSAKTALEQAQDQYNYTLQTVQMQTWQQPAYQVYDTGYYYGDLRGSLPQNVSNSSMSGNSSVNAAAQAIGQMISSYTTSSMPASSYAGNGSYLGNVNSLQTAQFNVEKAQIAFDQAQEAYDKATVDYKRQSDDLNTAVAKAELGLKSAKQQYQLANAKPRDVDVAPVKAQVDQAWVGVHLAEFQYDQTQLKAPSAGIVTNIAGDVGETASLAQPFITLDSQFLSIKALVSEADIAKIQLGQLVKLTFDAFSSTEEFTGSVYEIDPSETIVQGVVYYVVKVQFDAQGKAVKPGMTANLTIQTNTKSGVVKIPARAVQYDGDQAYVQVVKTEGSKKQVVEKRNVEIGLQGDEEVEVASGLADGEDVVTFTKS